MRPGLLLRIALVGFLAGWSTCARVLLLAEADAAVREAERVAKAAASDGS